VALENVSKRYGEIIAVQDFNLTTKDGEFVVLVGPSGCGKTTTMRMIAGLEVITAGSIKIGGQNVVGMIPRERDVAMVFQNYALFPHMNVFGNMAFGLRLRKLPKRQIEEQVQRAAKILGIESLLLRKPKELSGGQRQRVALGRAIVREPRVFLMDEPLSNIDAKLRVEMRAEIVKLQRRLGVTTFYVTHDQVEALSMGERVVVMLDGRVQQVGTPKELYNSPTNRFVAGFIGSPAMNFVRARIGKNGVATAGPDFELLLPASLGEKVARLHLEEVLVGIRPEHLKIQRDGTGKSKNVIRARVEVIEPQGSTTIIQFSAGGDSHLIALINEQFEAEPGSPLTLSVASEAIYLFDPATDRSVQ
ncbi:MAG: ABC transporter ATP-binding protein, partial [Verrucomicrobia bacterium]|nr:ABC transporter ATP-binding protein [Verrucomicrobiota bacterium]